MSTFIHQRVEAAQTGTNPIWAMHCCKSQEPIASTKILGNLDPALHAHVIPRYMTEPEDMRKGPAYFYDKDYRNSVKFDYERDKELLKQIAQAVRRRL